MSGRVPVSISVNGQSVDALVEPRTSLGDFLRHDLGLTGTHLGCEMGACGACLVLIDGHAAHSCLTYAVQVDGHTVETVEGLTERRAIADIQTAFHERNALQCGFCTPGMLITAFELLSGGGVPSRAEIRDALSGNYCRCTGYEAIVDAIGRVARDRAQAGQPAQNDAKECSGTEETAQ